jgi:hypothetical protein
VSQIIKKASVWPSRLPTFTFVNFSVCRMGGIDVMPSHYLGERGEHPLCDILIGVGSDTPAAK